MKQFRADLHVHSTCSDGTLSPFELLDLAKEIGLAGLSITDHDTTSAYTDAFFQKADSVGVRIITGVEISSRYRETGVHLLAYNFNQEDESFKQFISQLQNRRIDRNHKILEKLKTLDMPIEYDELVEFSKHHPDFKKKSIGRPHIALLMIEKGYVSDFRTAFDIYLKDDGKAFVETPSATPPQVIKEVKKAGGKTILAHPHFYRKRHFVKELLQMPFDGLEAYYSRLSPDQERKWVDRANDKGWIITGGSDFHGSVKPHIPLGCSWVNEETFNTLLAR